MEATSTALVRPEPHTAMSVFTPQTFEQALDFAARLQKSGFLGKDIKTPECALAIMVKGAELGFGPMQSFDCIYIVHQRPGLYADAMVGMVLASGKCRYFRTISVTDTEAVVEAHREGQPEASRASFSIEEARRTGLLAQNEKYKTDPQTMLLARARSRLCKRDYPDVIKGMPSVEELRDETQPPPVAMVEPLRQVEPTAQPSDADWLRRIEEATDAAALDEAVAMLALAYPDKAARPPALRDAVIARKKLLVAAMTAARGERVPGQEG